jgi:hypothetical protein
MRSAFLPDDDVGKQREVIASALYTFFAKVNGFLMALAAGKQRGCDLDLFASWVNGGSLQVARLQPPHPFIAKR